MPPALTGNCLCGAVRFEIDEMPQGGTYCHCTRCQRRTGTAYSAQAGIPASGVRFLSGEDEIRWWEPPDGFDKGFCPTCGSHLFSRMKGETKPFSVRLGALNERHPIRPARRIHVASAAHWEPIPDDGLPRFDGSATA